MSAMNNAHCTDCVDNTGGIESEACAGVLHSVDGEDEVDCADLEDSKDRGEDANDKDYTNVSVDETYALVQRTTQTARRAQMQIRRGLIRQSG